MAEREISVRYSYFRLIYPLICTVTLRDGDREFFYQALDRDFPGIRQKYVHTYGNAYDIPSPHAKELMALIRNTCSANSILCSPKECFAYLNEFPERYVQQTLF